MKTALLRYTTGNAGDDFQSFITACLVTGKPDAYVSRDHLSRFTAPEPHHLITNGWFGKVKRLDVPSRSLVPHYWGYCVGKRSMIRKPMISHWKRNAPIGCRDLTTLGIMRQRNISAYWSGCMTMWAGLAVEPPAKREGVLLVNCPPEVEAEIPASLLAGAERLKNDIPAKRRKGSVRGRFRAMAGLYEKYRRAELVITKKLHVLLPCLSMGTPVICIVPRLPAGADRTWRFNGFEWTGYQSYETGAIDLSSLGLDFDTLKRPTVPAECAERLKDLRSAFGARPIVRRPSFRDWIPEVS